MSSERGRPIPHTRDYFYVGGSYTTASGGSEITHGQLYVEHLAPIEKTRSIPILFIHGNGMTASNFLNTPDGRPGWTDYFLAQGYEVYLVDQPCRGRSPWHQGVDGSKSTMSVYKVESRFTATAKYRLWPQAVLHTQWPGAGTKGDPVFDAFYKSIVPSLTSPIEVSQLMKSAGTQLLDRIGPVILVTHSQSGSLGWILGDSRPHLVSAIVALEPVGPPFQQAVFASTRSRACGITDIPLTFDPPVLSPSDLARVVLEKTAFYSNIQQAPPARRLPFLARVPVLVVTSESGYHAMYDHCTVLFLRDAGVDVTHTRLEAFGIHGNGHMMFMERNSAEIAGVVEHWISKGSFKTWASTHLDTSAVTHSINNGNLEIHSLDILSEIWNTSTDRLRPYLFLSRLIVHDPPKRSHTEMENVEENFVSCSSHVSCLGIVSTHVAFVPRLVSSYVFISPLHRAKSGRFLVSMSKSALAHHEISRPPTCLAAMLAGRLHVQNSGGPISVPAARGINL